MNTFKNSKGFALFEIIVIVAVVGVLSLAGYAVYQKQQDKKIASNDTNTSQNSTATSTDEVPSAPELNKTSDLAAAEKTVDGIDVESSTADKAFDSATAGL